MASGQVICTRGQRAIETACGGDAAGAEVTQSSWHLLKQEIFGATQGISLHTRNGLLGEDVKIGTNTLERRRSN
ncbi:HAD superfamily hydrolase [Geitlerinema sp. FC II]|nr:HAD superfamily hydrolase [Geitlerinema sp. FC II]